MIRFYIGVAMVEVVERADVRGRFYVSVWVGDKLRSEVEVIDIDGVYSFLARELEVDFPKREGGL